MTERPILMHARSVQNILAGTKTQTRRIIKPQPAWHEKSPSHITEVNGGFMDGTGRDYPCPYGRPGDVLYVRETWREVTAFDPYRKPSDMPMDTPVEYRADWGAIAGHGIPWRPGIHMPKWASRIRLPVTSVRVERVQEISVRDIMAEGVVPTMPVDIFDTEEEHDRAFRSHWKTLWEDTNGEGAWERNDWVWVIEWDKPEVKM